MKLREREIALDLVSVRVTERYNKRVGQGYLSVNRRGEELRLGLLKFRYRIIISGLGLLQYKHRMVRVIYNKTKR